MPEPAAPVTLRLECRTAPHSEAGVAHKLTLYPDWSMRAKHELEAERVAAAFGGYTSCLRLEAPVTAAHDGLELLARRVPADCPGTVGGLDETDAVTQSLGPAPDGGPLEMRVECRTSRTASRGKQHSIVIEPDWTVRTPHDLEAERVAVAFGGFTSCLELVDKVIPAVQSTLPLLLRHQLARLTRTRGERVVWSADPVRGCRCQRGTFTSAQEAAAHLRSPAHLVKQYAVSLRPLTKVLAAVEGAWGGVAAPTAEARARAERAVREFRGSESLWEAGLHPEHVLEFAALAPGIDEPLPEAFFLGVAYSGVDVTWLATTVASRPDPAGAAWLAWVPADKGNAYLSALQDWYSLGLSRRQIEALAIEGVTITAAEALARSHGPPTPHRGCGPGRLGARRMSSDRGTLSGAGPAWPRVHLLPLPGRSGPSSRGRPALPSLPLAHRAGRAPVAGRHPTGRGGAARAGHPQRG